jgi:hypothetical protein
MYLDLLSEGYDDIKFIGVNGYQYIDDNFHCMICDDPSSCGNCDDIRVLPWVQDVPLLLNEDTGQDECEASGYTWQLGEQIIHSELNQIECEENEFTWQGGFQIIHDDLDQGECESSGYTWFHDDCIEFDAELCVEDIYGCMEPVDVWGNWDVTLRDLVVVNRQGYEVARLNLTSNNPDPSSTCGENYQTIKDLIIGAR